MIRQAFAKASIIHVMVQIGQNSSAGFYAAKPQQGIFQIEMRHMFFVAQRIDNPDIEPFQRCKAYRWNIMHIGRVSQITDPKTQGINPAVMDCEGQKIQRATRAFNGQCLARNNFAMGKYWRVISILTGMKRIFETAEQAETCLRIHIDRKTGTVAQNNTA